MFGIRRPLQDEDKTKRILEKIKKKLGKTGDEQPKVIVKVPEEFEKEQGVTAKDVTKEFVKDVKVAKEEIGFKKERFSLGRAIRSLFGYKIDVYILKKTMYGTVLEKDIGRIVLKEKGGTPARHLNLRKNKVDLPIPKSEKFLSSKGRPILFLASTVAKDFSPMNIKFANPETEISQADESSRLWFAYTIRQDYDKFKKQGTLEKLVPVLTVLAVAIGASLLIYISGTMAVEYAGIMSESSSLLASQIGRFADAMDKITGTVTPVVAGG
jgi:hypothetical protein